MNQNSKMWADGDQPLESIMRELEGTFDPEKQADLCRRIATQIASGIELGAVDPFAGVALMEEHIRDANSLVDDQNGLNNYAEAILTEQDRFKNHSKDWESSLSIDHPSIERFIEKHNRQPEGPREDNDLLRCLKTNPDPSLLLQVDQTMAQKASDSSETPMDTMPDFDVVGEMEGFVEEDSAEVNHGKMPNRDFDKNKVYPETKLPSVVKLERAAKDHQVPPGSRHAPPSSHFASSGQPPYYQQPPEHHQPPPLKSPATKAYINLGVNAGVGGTFRTAQQQLLLDRQKSGGGRGGRGVPNNTRGWDSSGSEGIRSNSYGGAGRTLGTRPGPAAGFKPPVRQNEQDIASAVHGAVFKNGGGVKPKEEEDEDPRYKNIDSKMIEMVKNEIMDQGDPVDWDDIAGLEFAKKTVREIVVLPLKRPDLFSGLRGPPKGLLLFGPPGTGKTLVGKCIASRSGSTFFSISASSLTSKWVGEGEKMVRALFAVAKVHQPSVVFIDEIDSLLTARSDSDHESSRRIKTEFLVQLDGANTVGEERVLVVGATNRPQELDEAARRRLVKRLYIPLPEGGARRRIIQNLLAKERHCLTDQEMEEVVDKTDGYSGADMANLCKEAAMGPIRSVDFEELETIAAGQVRPIEAEDFVPALRQVKASVSQGDLDTYLKWNQLYGATS